MTPTLIQDYELRENPRDTMKRLRETGSWNEANKLLRKIKQAYHRRFKKAGGALNMERRLEMAKAAWDAVHERWPPPEDALPLGSLNEYLQQATPAGKRGSPDLPALSAAADRRFDEIGDVVDEDGEIQWVYLHIGNRKVEAYDCPSRGAWTMLENARKDPHWFYEKMYRPMVDRKARMKRSGDNEGQYTPSKAEKMAVAEIREMIEEARAAIGLPPIAEEAKS